MNTRVTYKSNLALCMAVAVMVMPIKARNSFKTCYLKCFVPCVIENDVPTCQIKCLVSCYPPSNFTKERLPSGDPNVTKYFCGFGCSASLCGNISTKTDPAEEKVSHCVDSCSEKMCSNSSQ
ncbi:hypothetical protein SAY87_028775 [Trapa incisa]|uniref:Thionin-like protein 2 n=1 Tax=Trapa incisa TaxID=236973 RepID=A0AAN7KVC2_9MYRT|nr:hypothetical protein SAY87_028775 [Trapa incisa]